MSRSSAIVGLCNTGANDGDGRRWTTQRDGRFFANTHIVLLILLSFCCSYIGLILGVVGLVTCKDPVAKQNATITTILSVIFSVLGTIGGIKLQR